MDGSIFWLLVLLGAGWFFTFTAGFNMGIKYERFRHDKEVDAYVIPEENLQDGAYWKMRYEDLVAENEAVMASAKRETKDAPGETTE